ncbi:MAG: NAD-dependent epimerase/dehydratase family protein [Mangrovibacterium sp.]
MRVIVTGATGMVGEGVLFECINNPKVSEILIVGRKKYETQNPKVKQLLVSDFLKTGDFLAQLKGYDACFFCAGISSVGLNEEKYTLITYDVTLAFGKAAREANPDMVFVYVSGRGTDSTEKGKTMWARVKGKTENDLQKIGFKAVYNFRPALMIPFQGQISVKPVFNVMAKVLKYVMPKATLTLSQVGKAMINAAGTGYAKTVLEVADIRAAAEKANG